MKEVQQHNLIRRLIPSMATGFLACLVVFTLAINLNALLGLNNQIKIVVVEEKPNNANDEQDADGEDVYFIAPSPLHSIAKPVLAPMAGLCDNPTKPFLKQVTPPPEHFC